MAGPSRKTDQGREQAATDLRPTGDKAVKKDPAAAPVHTDAEAATTTTAEQLASSARRQEQSYNRVSEAGMASSAVRPLPFANSLNSGAVLVVGSLAVLVLAGWLAGLVSVAGL